MVLHRVLGVIRIPIHPIHRVLGVLPRVLMVLHRVLGVSRIPIRPIHRVLGVLHRVLMVLHRVLGVIRIPMSHFCSCSRSSLCFVSALLPNSCTCQGRDAGGEGY